MGVKDLYELGGVAPVAFKCDQCGHVWDNDRDAAWCCGPVSCEACSRVIEETTSKDYRGLCWDCRKAHLAEQDVASEIERYQNAAKLPWDQRTDVLMLPNGQFWQDGDGPIEFDYAWACTEDRVGIGADIVIDSMLDDFEQDVTTIDDEAVEQLQKLLDGWIARHLSDVSAHVPDFTRCVLVVHIDTPSFIVCRKRAAAICIEPGCDLPSHGDFCPRHGGDPHPSLREREGIDRWASKGISRWTPRVCVGRAEDGSKWAPYCTMDGPCDLCGTFLRSSLDLLVVNRHVNGVYCNRICANGCAWTPCGEVAGCDGSPDTRIGREG
jgi:hypothetical protein